MRSLEPQKTQKVVSGCACSTPSSSTLTRAETISGISPMAMRVAVLEPVAAVAPVLLALVGWSAAAAAAAS
jgi:hypothetical protein